MQKEGAIMGILQKCITSDGLVMAAFLDSTDIVLEAQRIHGCTPVAIDALGRLLTGASIMGNKLKEEDASITVRIGGNGPIGALIAVSDNQGNVRGYAQVPGLLIYPDANGNLDVPGAIGKNGFFFKIDSVRYAVFFRKTADRDIQAFFYLFQVNALHFHWIVLVHVQLQQL